MARKKNSRKIAFRLSLTDNQVSKQLVFYSTLKHQNTPKYDTIF